jgi:ATP-binding cassette, subfamily B, bacterial
LGEQKTDVGSGHAGNDAREIPAGKAGTWRLYSDLLREARPFAPQIALLLFTSLLSAPLTLLLAYPIKITIDSVLGGNPLPAFISEWLPAGGSDMNTRIIFAVALLVIVAFVLYLVAIVHSGLAAYVGESLALRFRVKLFQHAQHLSVAYHDRGTADTLYRIQHDATALEKAIVDGVLPVIASCFTIIAMLLVCLQLDWILTLCALAIAPILIAITIFYRTHLKERWHEVKSAESSALSVAQEVLGSIRAVKAFAQENQEVDRFVRRSAEVVRARTRAALVEGLFAFMIGFTVAAGTAGVLYMGAQHVLNGTIGPGDLALVMLYLGMLYQPLQAIGVKAGALQSAFASADRVYALLALPADVPERPRSHHLARATGAIRCEKVSFAYEPGHMILRDITFEVAPGDTVCIRGTTGSGKSSLLGLLCRFFDPVSGAIKLDGCDLRDYRLKDLRSQFAMVMQEPVLMSATIAENIAYSRRSASHEDIRRAATLAHADEFISRLPDGFATEVGERGMRLSGGQRQRIALARAFLKNAPILLLDEPTSAVDLGTEELVMDALETLASGRTTFFISHRPRLLTRRATTLILERGQLLEAS